jgi:hypothetical protein
VRVLLDENLPADLAQDLAGHEVSTVAGEGWVGITNGELLRRMGGRFDALLTMDRNLQYQQNVRALSFGIVLVRAASNRLVHVRPLVPAILGALRELRSGELRAVGA